MYTLNFERLKIWKILDIWYPNVSPDDCFGSLSLAHIHLSFPHLAIFSERVLKYVRLPMKVNLNFGQDRLVLFVDLDSGLKFTVPC